MNEPTLIEFDKRQIPMLPQSSRGKTLAGSVYVKSTPREWTDAEIDWLYRMKDMGFTNSEIAKSMGRTEVSIGIKLKRIGKKNGRYNDAHKEEKYAANQQFLDTYKPEDILDLYCGKESWWDNHTKAGTVETNDIDKSVMALNHKPAERLVAELYSRGCTYDLIDLDPFGSAYDCFDLAIRMAQKAIIVTFGEMGHKRWKRFDFVRYRYGIENLSDFTTERLISEFRRIGLTHKKDLVPVIVKEWPRISRVYFEVRPIKVTEQWESATK